MILSPITFPGLGISVDPSPVAFTLGGITVYWYGIILAAGFCGQGFGTAPAVGYMLAQIVAGEPTLCDLTPLKYERFYEI